MLWLLRWLLFRLEFGAGLIKMRGDRVLAGPDLPVLPPRDPADAGPAELVLPPPAQAAAPGGGGGQPLRPARRAVRPVRPAAGGQRGRAAIIIVTQLWLVLSRQLRLAQLADDRAGVRAIDDASLAPGAAAVRPRRACAAPPPGSRRWCSRVTALVVVLSYWPARNLSRAGS